MSTTPAEVILTDIHNLDFINEPLQSVDIVHELKDFTDAELITLSQSMSKIHAMIRKERKLRR